MIDFFLVGGFLSGAEIKCVLHFLISFPDQFYLAAFNLRIAKKIRDHGQACSAALTPHYGVQIWYNIIRAECRLPAKIQCPEVKQMLHIARGPIPFLLL